MSPLRTSVCMGLGIGLHLLALTGVATAEIGLARRARPSRALVTSYEERERTHGAMRRTAEYAPVDPDDALKEVLESSSPPAEVDLPRSPPPPTTSAPAAKAPEPAPAAAQPARPPFSPVAAQIALRDGRDSAPICRMQGAHGPTRVLVTFDGETGDVRAVRVAAGYAGTPAEACVQRRFARAHVPPFEQPSATIAVDFDL